MLEVDLLFERDGKIHPVEVKSGATLREDFFTNIKKLKNYKGVNIEKPYLIYGGDNIQKRSDFTILPWNAIEILKDVM